MIAFHFARAAELDPDEERRAEAFDTSIQASVYAARRGAAARAQELAEQAARFAPDDRRLIEVLKRASDLAMHRLRGDDGVRLMVAAAERSEEAGDAIGAARCYAIAVEYASRLGGVAGRFEESFLLELLERAERLAPNPDPDLGARLKLDRAWLPWSYGRPDDMAEPVSEGRELATQTDDVLLRSCALDAASATAWWAGRYSDVEALNRERVEVLARATVSAGRARAERRDQHDLRVPAPDGQVARGAAVGRAERERARSRRSAHRGRALDPGAVPARRLGPGDRARRRVRDNWDGEGRPPFVPFAPDLAAVATIHGLRGDEAAHRDWASVAEEVAGSSQQLPGVRMFEAEVALHFGDVERAVDLVDGLWAGFWWQGLFLARRAEIFAIAGRRDAREALERAEARLAGDPVSTAVALRARAVIAGDDAPLRQALETFERVECVYEAARTRWMLGGAERNTAVMHSRRSGRLPKGA